jgi:hypothetical protein
MDYTVNGVGVGKDPNSISRTDTYKNNFDKIGNSKENIKVAHNFISPEVCDQLIASKGIANKHHDEFWSERIFTNEDITKIAGTFRDQIKNFIDAEYGVTVSSSPPAISSKVPTIISWHPGVDMGLHVDDLGVDEYHIASLIYLNDDFEGGEISFPTHGISIKPSKGDLIVFPGNLNYPHKIEPIVSGNRYTVPFWFKYE